MGKVQEALAKVRITSRPTTSRTRVALADRLRVPTPREQQPEQRDSTIPSDASGISEWIVARNAANSAASRANDLAGATTLLQALLHCNRTTCTPTARLEIMAALEKPFARALQGLDSRYLYLDFPLQPYTGTFFQLAVTLCAEMVSGYKIAIVNTLVSESENKLSLFSDKKPLKNTRRDAIALAITHLSQLAVRHSQIHREWPEGFWQDLNGLIAIAIHDRTNNITRQGLSGHGLPGHGHLSIEQQFASLCALSVLDQNQHTAEQLRSLFVKITEHAALVTFYQTADLLAFDDQAADIYRVGENNPPSLDKTTLTQPDPTQRYFNLDTLLKTLHAENATGSSHTHYQRTKRQQTRSQRSVSISAETGLQNIHTRISITPPVENSESQFTELEQLLSNTGSDSFKHQSENQSNATTLLDQTDSPLCSTSFEVENESPCGLGLKWTGEGSCKVQVGELLAHCYRNGNREKHDNSVEISWHLGIVRWLRSDDDGTLRLGVESVSHHTRAITVERFVKSSQNPQSTDGLLINYQPIDCKANMLILPQHNYKAGEQVTFNDNNRRHTVRLMERVEISGGYQCFATTEIEQTASRDIEAGLQTGLCGSDFYPVAV